MFQKPAAGAAAPATMDPGASEVGLWAHVLPFKAPGFRSAGPAPASPRRDWLSCMWAEPLCWDSRRLTRLVPTWPGASLSGPDGGELGSAEKGGQRLLGDPDQVITSIALGRWFTKRSL